MICERCGTYMPDDAITCDKCGTLLSRQKTPETGVQALRQGKAGAAPVVMPSDKQKELPIYDDFGQLPQTRRPPQVERSKSNRAQQRAARFEHDAGRPTMKRGVPSVGGIGSRQVRSKPAKVYQVQKHMVNWTHMILYMALFVIMALAGGYFYLSHTDGGQRGLLAGRGRILKYRRCGQGHPVL